MKYIAWGVVLFVVLLHLDIISVGAKQTVPDNKIRASLVKSKVGEPVFKLGKSVEKSFVGPLRSAKRNSLYNIKTKKFKKHSAEDRISNFNPTGPDFAINVSDYVQGVALYSIMGIILIILTLLLLLGLSVTCCWGCYLSCCSNCGDDDDIQMMKKKKKSHKDDRFYKEERSRELLSSNGSHVEEDEKKQRKEKIKNIVCRLVMITWVLFGMSCLIVITIFHYHINVDVSVAINQGVDMVEDVQNMVYDVQDLISGVNGIVSQVHSGIEEISDYTLGQLPSKDEIDGYLTCIHSIIDGLPNIQTLMNFVKDAKNRTDRIPSIPQFEKRVKLIEGDVKLIYNSDLPSLTMELSSVHNDLNGVKGNVTSLKQYLIEFRALFDLMPNSTYCAKLVNEREDQFDKIGTSFLTELQFNLTNLNDSNIHETSNALKHLVHTIEDLRQFNTVELFSIINQMNSSLHSVPKISSIRILVNHLKRAYSDITVSDITTLINLLGVRIDNMKTNITFISSDLDTVTSIVDNFPSISIVTTETDKINATIERMVCIDGLIVKLKEINETLIELPQAVGDIVANFDKYKEEMKGISIDELIGDSLDLINETISVTVPQMLDKLDGVNLKNITDSAPNMTKYTEMASDTELKVIQAKAQVNLTSVDSSLDTADKKISDVPDLKDIMNSIIELNDTVQTFPTDELKQVSNILDNLPSPCVAPICPGSIGQDHVVSAIQALINALEKKPSRESTLDHIDSFEKGKVSVGEVTPYIDKCEDAIDYIDNISIINEIITSIQDIRKVLKSVIDSVPWNDIYHYMDLLGPDISSKVDFSSILNDLQNYKDQLDPISSFSIDDKLHEVTDSVSTIDFNSFTGGIDSVTSTVNSTDAQIEKIMDKVDSYKQKYLPIVYKYDGLRGILLLLLILFLLPIPLIGAIPAVTPRKWPTFWTLLLVATLYLIIALFTFILVGLSLPAGVLIGDVCHNVGYYVNSTASAFAGNMMNQSISFEQELFAGRNLSIHITVADLIPFYLEGCQGDDQIVMALNQAKDLVNDLPSIVDDEIHGALSSDFNLRQGVFDKINSVIGRIADNASALVDDAIDLVQCQSINKMYNNAKSVVCQRASYTIDALWMVEFLFGLLCVASAIASTAFYCFLQIDDRRNGSVTPSTTTDETPRTPKNIMTE